MSGALGSFPDHPLAEPHLEQLREHDRVRLAEGALTYFNVESEQEYATAIVVVTTSRVAGLKWESGAGWSVEYRAQCAADDDPWLLFMEALEAMGYVGLPEF